MLVVTFLHSLWQGPAIACCLWTVLRVLPSNWPRLRYAAALSALAVLALAVPVTYTVLGLPEDVITGRSTAASPVTVMPPAIPPITAGVPASSPVNWFVVVLSLWALGALIMLIRLIMDLRMAGRLLAQAREPDEALWRRAQRLRAQARLWRTVRVLVIDHLPSPAVVGVLRPVILMPAAIVCEMSPAHLEAVLLHELAHIRRHDYLINLLQRMLEALLFFNPAIWWISRQIRIEREACCDAFAARKLGEPARMAEAIERSAKLVLPRLAIAMGSDERTLLERVKRLLVPGHRPGVRMNWVSIAGMLCISALLLAGLWRGTTVAVAAAAEAMDSRQRVERVAELQKTHTDEVKKGKARLMGRVVTEDGSPLPNGTQVMGSIRAGNSQIGTQMALRGWEFENEVPAGEVQLAVKAEGFAPTQLQPFYAEPNETYEDILLTLKRGREVRVRLQDEAGQAIAGAKLKAIDHVATFLLDVPSSGDTDADGWVTLRDVSDRPIQLNTEVKGFERAKKEVRFSDEVREERWTLTRAPVVQGRVTAKADGRPVAAARVILASEEGGNSWFPRGDSAQVLSVSGQDGSFTLDTLSRQGSYGLFIEADGFTPYSLLEYSPSSGKLDVAMAPGVVLRGKIVGTADELAKVVSKSNRIEVGQSVQVAPQNSYGGRWQVPVTMRDGAAHFEIRDPYPGEITIAGKTISANKSIDDLNIDLASAPAPKTRRVELRLAVPEGSAPARGTVRIVRNDPNGTGRYREWTQVPVENGAVMFDVVAGENFQVESHGLVGYWVKEKDSIRVPDEAGVFQKAIVTMPAGAISGTVTESDGTPIDASIWSVVVDMSSVPPQDRPQFQPTNAIGTGQFLVGPLPLPATYRLVASRNGAYAITEVVELTPAEPIKEVKLTFVPGVDFVGRVVGPDGKPAFGVAVHPTLTTAHSYDFSGAEVRTDDDGIFRTKSVSPDWPGMLAFTLEPRSQYKAARFEVKPGTTEATFRLEKGLNFRGRVVDDATGDGIRGARVRLFPNSPASIPVTYAVTDADGWFEATTLSKANYWLFVNDYDPAGTTYEKLDNGWRTHGSERVEVRPGDPQREFRVVTPPWRK